METVIWVQKSGVDCISPFKATKMEFNCLVNKLVEFAKESESGVILK